MEKIHNSSTFIIKWLPINETERPRSLPMTSINAASSTEGLDAFKTMLIVGMVVTMSVAVIGVIGNLLTITTLFHQFRMPPRKRYVVKMTADTILILNLCVADLCYCGISLPIVFVIYKGLYCQSEDSLDTFEPFRGDVCKWGAFIRYTNAIIEWTTLGMMALERCVTIYRFQRKMCPSRLFTPGRTFSYCVVICFLGMSAETLTLTDHYGAFGYNYATLKCDFMPSQNQTFIITPRVFFFALESAIPCCCILIGYVIILCQVYSSTSFFGGSNSLTSSTQMSMALRRSKTTRLIVMLLTVYLVCVIPICIYNVAISEDNLGNRDNQIIGIALYCLYWIQYGVNNFIYVVSNEKYRNAYRQLFCLLLCKDVESASGSHHLRTFSIKPLPQSAVVTSDLSKMRLRTPSEMMMECQEENRSSSYKRRPSKMRISFMTAPSIDLDSLKEVPILIFPTAKLNKMYSSFKKKTDFNLMFNCVGKRRHLCFHDSKKCKRRLSLNVFENSPSSERKRSLSV